MCIKSGIFTHKWHYQYLGGTYQDGQASSERPMSCTGGFEPATARLIGCKLHAVIEE